MKKAEKLDSDGIARLKALISGTRRAIAADVAEAKGWDVLHLAGIKRSFDKSVDELSKKYKGMMEDVIPKSFDLGQRMVKDPLKAAKIMIGKLPAIDPKMLEVLQGMSADLIDGISADLLKRINSEISTGILTGKRPYEVMTAIGRNLEDPSVFKTVFERAENITRTEMVRAQSTARQARMEEVKKVVPEMKEEWLTADRPCDECEPLDHNIFEIGEGPEPPLHPNCLCVRVPYLAEVE